MTRPTIEEVVKMSDAEYRQHRLDSLDELIQRYDDLIIAGRTAAYCLLGAPVVVTVILYGSWFVSWLW